MVIQVTDLKFGETDAKNEVFQQARYGSDIFFNAFQIPPRVDLDDLLRGARFFISGQKGCGKTALLLHVQRRLSDLGAKTHTILFKSGISETERAKLSGGVKFEIMDTSKDIGVEYDYTTNWLWLIYRNLLRLIDEKDVLQGANFVKDLKKLTGVSQETKQSTFSDLAISRVRGAAKAGLRSGPFSAEVSGDVEALPKTDSDRAASDVIEICEKYLVKIVIEPRKRCLLFFDELELFWSRPDQRERDLFLIRDLLQSVARVNRALGAHSASFVVYASVRSEVLEEVNRVGPEIVRDITDFGVAVSWNTKMMSSNQPILKIVEAKINASEIEADELPTDDVWGKYFTNQRIYGRDIRDYLLNISMFKPRHIVSRLNLAKAHDPHAIDFSFESFDDTSTDFSQTVWREVEEELLGRYTAKQVSNIKAFLTGFKANFKVFEFENRVRHLGRIDPTLEDGFESKAHVVEACKVLYRLGALGNSFRVPGARGLEKTRSMVV